MVGGVGAVAVEGVREAAVVGYGGSRTWMQSSSMGCDSWASLGRGISFLSQILFTIVRI